MSDPGAPKPPDDLEAWTTPFDSELFVLKKVVGKQSKLWSFFCHVVRAKDDVSEDDLPTKWKNKAPGTQFSMCNKCGLHFVCGNTLRKTQTLAGMHGHISSGNGHSTTLDDLAARVEKHLISKDPNPERAAKRLKAAISTQGSISGFAKSGNIQLPPPLKKKDQELKTVHFIVDCMLPFSTVQKKSFRAMIKSHNPSATPMSNRKVKAILLALEEAMRNKCVEMMAGEHVSITLDHWTSKANQNYLGITAHFIDKDWNARSVPLGVFLHEGGSNAEELEKEFLKTWSDIFKQDNRVNIFSTTTDTTGNMNSFGMRMEKLGIHHLYCTDHVMDLSAKLVIRSKKNHRLEEAVGEELVESIDKARAHVKHLNKSPKGLAKLKSLQTERKIPLGVIVDIITRWWSTLSMMDRMLALRPVINQMRAGNFLVDVPKMTSSDWESIKQITEVLKPFKSAMKVLEGNKYVTGSLVASIVLALKKQLKIMASEAQPDTNSQRFAALLFKDLEERWVRSDGVVFDGHVHRGAMNRQVGIHPAFIIATFLDPRYKNLGSLDDDTKKAVHCHVLNLMKEVEQKSRSVVHPTLEQCLTDAALDNMSDDSEEDEEDNGLFSMIMEQEQAASQESAVAPGAENVDDKCEAELKKFLSTVPMDRGKKDTTTKKFVHSDPLDWWKIHETKFPNLGVLARKFLAIQASSAPSERIFSQASLLISDKRTRLDPKIAGKALFVKQNWESFEEELNYLKIIGGKDVEKFFKALEELEGEESDNEED